MQIVEVSRVVDARYANSIDSRKGPVPYTCQRVIDLLDQRSRVGQRLE